MFSLQKGVNVVLHDALKTSICYISENLEGLIQLSLKFEGHLKVGLTGLYMSTYKDELGDDHRIATTQFEPTHARK